MKFKVPKRLINLLQIQFQVQEVMFCYTGTDSLHDLDLNYLFDYHNDYHKWTATSTCGSGIVGSGGFNKPSLVICPDVSNCMALMESLPITQRLSNTFLAQTTNDLECNPNYRHKIRLDDNLFTFDHSNRTILEHYSIQGQHVQQVFGNWYQNDTLILVGNQAKWERRSDLMGVQLRATVLNWVPHSFQQSEHEHGYERDTWKGYFIDAAKTLKSELNFTFKYTSPSDKEWGVKKDSTENSSVSQWTGMVGQLVDDKADICLSAVSLTLDRAEVIDFTWSLVTAPLTITGLKPGKSIKGGYEAFLRVFSHSAWFGLVAMAVAVGTATSVVLYNNNPERWDGFHLGVIRFGLSCLQLGNVISGNSHAWRMLQVTMALCGYLCFTAYTSDLTAILTVGQPGQLPKSFKEVVSEDYKILAASGAWPAINMKNSPPGSCMRKAYDNHTTMFDYDGNMDVIFDKMTLDPKLLYYGDSVQFYKHGNLEAVTDFEEITIFKLPIGLQKDSELRDVFNYHLIKMRQAGLFSKLSRQWMKDNNPGDWSEQIFVEEATAIGYSNVLFPILILTCGVLIAISLAFIEKLKACLSQTILLNS